jgi:hypothetical protein
MSQWFYAKDGKQNGPVSLEELQRLLAMGSLAGGDLVWNQNMKDWLPASSVPEISTATAVSPPQNPLNPYATPGSAWNEGVATGLTGLSEIEPGSEPIHVTGCLKRGFELTGKNFLVLFLGLLIIIAISIAAMLPFAVIEGATGTTPVLPPEVANDPVRAFQYGMRTQFTVTYFLQQAVSMIVSSFLMAGYYRICLNLASNLPASPGQIFGEGGKILKMVGISIILAIPTWIGFGAFALVDVATASVILGVMVLIGLVLWIRMGFAGFALVDRNSGVIGSLKYSASITRNNTFRLIGFGILLFLITIVGMIPCGLGLLFTMPMCFMATAVAYRYMQYGHRAALDQPVRVVPPPGGSLS